MDVPGEDLVLEFGFNVAKGLWKRAVSKPILKFAVELLEPRHGGPLRATEFKFRITNRSTVPIKLHAWWPFDPQPSADESWVIVPVADNEIDQKGDLEVVVRLETMFTHRETPVSAFLVRFAVAGMAKPLEDVVGIAEVEVGCSNSDVRTGTTDWWARRNRAEVVSGQELLRLVFSEPQKEPWRSRS